MHFKVAEIETALAKFNRWTVADYRGCPVPSNLDGEITDMLLEYGNLAEPQRSEARQLVNSPHLACILLIFAERMLRIGIDKKSEAGLYIAALALVMENRMTGEGTRLLAALVNEAAKITAGPDLFWSRVRGVASSQMAHYINQILAGPAAPATSIREQLVA